MIVSAESTFVVTIIAVHIAAALLGLVATGTIAHLACRRLVFDEPVSDPALINQLQSLSILALCIVIGSSATLIVLWMELYCIPGDEPMIFRIDLARIPSKTTAKIALALVLAVCALAVDRYPLLALRDVSRARARTTSLREFFELSLFASAPFICWVAITGIALIPALRTWSAFSLLAATTTVWLIVLSALLLMSLIARAQTRTRIGSGIKSRAIMGGSLLQDVSDGTESSFLFTLHDAQVGHLTASVNRDPNTGEYRPVIQLMLPTEANGSDPTQNVIWSTEADFIVKVDESSAVRTESIRDVLHSARGWFSRGKPKVRAA
ncbi:MAG: hypothetical protein AAGB04_31135 [Pseudomonadota bacterium]